MRTTTYILTSLFSLILVSNAFGQIPPEIEKPMDAFYTDVIKIYKIIKEEDTETALRKIDEIQPRLLENAQAYVEAASNMVYQQEYDEAKLEEQIQNKPYFQEMWTLMGDEEFMAKYQSSPEIQKKMEEISKIMNEYFGGDEEEEMYEEEYGYGEGFENNEAVFTLELDDNSYTVMSNYQAGAIAYSQDEEDYTSIEIMGEVNGGEATITFFVYNTGQGKHEWDTDGHFTLEFMNEDGDTFVSLWGSEEMGYIQVDKFGGINDFIEGSIVGECMVEDGDKVPIKATFKVRRLKVDY